MTSLRRCATVGTDFSGIEEVGRLGSNEERGTAGTLLKITLEASGKFLNV
jgi:hypothetical protein